MEKINVAELLRNCPKGMELDCTMFDDVVFDHISTEANTHPIFIKVKNSDFTIQLTMYGQYMDIEDAKCVIFPKGKTTWEGFVPSCNFKDGDILYCDANDSGEDKDMFKYIFIFDKIVDVDGTQFYYSYCHLFGSEFYTTETNLVNDYPVRFATEKEKQKLFQAIKDNGYKWNPETKTLEKLIEPKFKVRDRIKQIGSPRCYIIQSIEFDRYILHNGQFLKFGDEHIYELVPKFDINILVPFESKVLVRNDEGQYWIPAFWGCKRADGYTTTFGWCKYCVPFEGNEHLLETNNDCNEFYKTWK